MTRRYIRYNMYLNWVPNEIFDEVMDIWKIPSLISLYGDFTRSQICHDKTTFRSKTDPTNKFLNLGNGLIVFSSSSSTHRHTSTRSCYNIYSRLWGLSVPTFRIFEDFRGFWLGTSNIYPGCPAKNILDFTMKIFFFKKSKNRSRWLYAELNSKYNHRDRIFENFPSFL